MPTLVESAEIVQEQLNKQANDMKRQLRSWRAQGLIGPHFTVETRGTPHAAATFQVTGEARPHVLDHPTFMVYADGFNARRTAVMNRKPRNTDTSSRKKKTNRD